MVMVRFNGVGIAEDKNKTDDHTVDLQQKKRREATERLGEIVQKIEK